MQFLILGNGFDLASGLKTSYKDYFDDLQKRHMNSFSLLESLLDENIPSMIEIPKQDYPEKFMDVEYLLFGYKHASIAQRISKTSDKMKVDQNRVMKIFKQKLLILENYNKINFWMIYFWKLKILDDTKIGSLEWNQIEDNILKLINKKDNKDNQKSTLVSIFDLINVDVEDVLKSTTEKVLLFTEQEFIKYTIDITHDVKRNEKINLILYLLYFENVNDEKELFDILLDQLLIFEKDFADYIRKIQENVIYQNDNYRIYLENLDCFLENKLGGSEPENVYILNFNYTKLSPIAYDNSITQKVHDLYWESKVTGDGILFPVEINNIHGTFNKVSIFGVDQSKIKYNSRPYTFTKTYRNLIERDVNYNSSLPKAPAVKKISFFGHSLSSADYSYFQSIFDYYSLYSSNLQLVFYYSLYDDISSREMRIQTTKSIIELLDEYGKTMDNVDHGKNLLHKLMLENRIIIKEVKLKNLL